MAEAYLELLKAFNFTEMQAWIAVISAFLFTSCLLGGFLSALAYINSNLLHPRPLKERISFRLFILAEVVLWIFVFFYHVFMIEEIILAHVVYWVSATIMMALLAIIGSQLMMVIFSGKMKAKDDEYKRRQRAIREQRRKEMDEGVGSNPAERAMARRQHKPG
ncbi:hypothetical protein [Magnetovibrio sp.]|uniref:hypothetical protein n=1 Tax=Magnetovibrio sp. TaxID=2024836 RepID=UPI002F9529D4